MLIAHIFYLFKGKEIANESPEHVAPEEKLDQGILIKDFAKEPSDKELQGAIPYLQGANLIGLLPITTKRVKGKMLDENVQIGR